MSTTHVGSGSVPPAREPFQVHRSHVPQGTALVEASAGTGKTFNIAMSVVRLLLERDARGAPLVRGVGSILVVTFTKAATDELISRIRTVLREAHELFHGRPTSASHATEQLLITVADGRDPGFDLEPFRPHRFHGLSEVGWDNPFTAGERGNEEGGGRKAEG